MARSGRTPKPTALRILHGDRKDRINYREPVPAVGPMEPPDGMSDEVRAVWDFTVHHLTVMGLAMPSDRECLRAYCEAVVGHAKASAVVARSAILVKGLHGTLVRNPALQIQRDMAKTLLRFAQEFGLTPAARTRIETADQDTGERSPFAGAG
jgi:P27 family predicted phage terminase small subunit